MAGFSMSLRRVARISRFRRAAVLMRRSWSVRGHARAACASQSQHPVLVAFSLFASLVAIGVVSPAAVDADATVAPPPVYSAAPGLPDGRVYEQVSPIDKNGNQAGASTNTTLEYGGLAHYALAAPDGNGVLFEGSGPMGETAAGYNLYFVAERSSSGWNTRSIFPRLQTPTTGGTITVQPDYVDPSADLFHVMFEASQGLFAPPPYPGCSKGAGELYLSGSDPLVAATWLAQPAIANPIEVCGEESEIPVGGTPDFSTVYFTYPGTLLPEDAIRAPYQTNTENIAERTEPWGFYEYSGGVLSEAGVLPNGSLDPFGAVPAVSGHGRGVEGNQVADEGKLAFFVSPDPASCGNGNDCAADPPELYVRERGETTVLVSKDTLLPPVEGLPVGAPDGALGFTGATAQPGGGLNTSFVYASPDGSQAFFESDDDLTEEAQRLAPGMEAKMYDFDVETGALTYLPGVVGQIVASSENGSSFAFVDSSGSPSQLDLWSGPGAGTITPVTPLPEGGVGVARMSSDGSVVVFQTGALIAGFNSGHYEQIYRYDVATNMLSCVSCAPAGTTPSSNAELTPLRAGEAHELDAETIVGLVDERGISADGDRIFFDTADPLVPQDSNTGWRYFDGPRETLEEEQVGRDVYEWENGTVYLISSGKSSRNSYLLDNSENGEDVFFATTEGLVPGDTDGGYDVYDARIPHPGDSQPPAAVPCEGSVCQGAPQVPAPLSAPASATFSGPGNPMPPLAVKPAVSAKPKSKPVRCRRGYEKKKGKCVKRHKVKKAHKSSHSQKAGSR
jgi:hypothetical protein